MKKKLGPSDTSLDGKGIESPAFREGWLFTLFLTISGVVVFWLPWIFPPSEPVKGESYTLGFNNAVAVIGLIACVVVHGVLLIIRHEEKSIGPSCLGWLRLAADRAAHRRTNVRDWFVLASITFVQVAIILWWNGVLVSPYWSESAYFLSRIDLLALGFLPYRDFQFLYGPAMLYGPLLVDRLTLATLGIENSYAVWVGICYVLGNLCLLVFLRGLNISRSQSSLALLGGLLLFLPLTMGLNYTPLRFTLLPCLLVVFFRLDAGLVGRKFRDFYLALAVFCSVVLGLFVSPEMGIGTVVGLLAYSVVLFWRRERRSGVLAVAGGCLAVAVTLLLFSPEYLAGIFTFKGGGNNFPIYPNLHSLVLLAAVQCVFPLLGSAALMNPRDSRSALAVALCCAGGILLFASFGRCDPGHVFLNGLIPLLTMFAAAGSFGTLFARAWSGGFILCVVVVLVSYFNHYSHLFLGSLEERRRFEEQGRAWSASLSEEWDRLRRLSPNGDSLTWRKHPPISSDLVNLVSQSDLALYGAFDLGFDRLMKLQSNFRPHYHVMPTPEIYTMRDVDRATADFLQHDGVLVPSQLVESIDAQIDNEAYAKGISSFLSGLMVFPVEAQVRNTPFLPEREILRQLIKKCEVAPSPIEGMVLLRPKPQFQGK